MERLRSVRAVVKYIKGIRSFVHEKEWDKSLRRGRRASAEHTSKYVESPRSVRAEAESVKGLFTESRETNLTRVPRAAWADENLEVEWK